MTQYYPDKISVEVSRSKRLEASKCDLEVSIKGSSAVAGNEAVKKAREVRAFCDELSKNGIEVEKIDIQGVSLESKKGAFLVSSKATYRVLIRDISIANLSLTLSIIARQKAISMNSIQWYFPEIEVIKESLLQEVTLEAKQKGLIIANSLRVRFIGVYSFKVIYHDPDDLAYFESPDRGRRLSKSIAVEEPDNLQLDLNHADYITVTVKAEFKVSEFIKQPTFSAT